MAQLEELYDDDGERRGRVTMIVCDMAQPEVSQLFCTETRPRRMMITAITMMDTMVLMMVTCNDDEQEEDGEVTMIICKVAQPEVNQLFCIETRLRRDDVTVHDDDGYDDTNDGDNGDDDDERRG